MLIDPACHSRAGSTTPVVGEVRFQFRIPGFMTYSLGVKAAKCFWHQPLRQQVIQTLGWVVGLSSFVVFAEWYVVSPIGYGGQMLLFLSGLLYLPWLLAWVAVPLSVFFVPWRRTREHAVTVLVCVLTCLLGSWQFTCPRPFVPRRFTDSPSEVNRWSWPFSNTLNRQGIRPRIWMPWCRSIFLRCRERECQPTRTTNTQVAMIQSDGTVIRGCFTFTPRQAGSTSTSSFISRCRTIQKEDMEACFDAWVTGPTSTSSVQFMPCCGCRLVFPPAVLSVTA